MAPPKEFTETAHALQFEALRTQFVKGLARRLEEIDTTADATHVYAALHRLAGAAGGYGFDALEQNARAAMLALKKSPTEPLHATQQLSILKACIRSIAENT